MAETEHDLHAAHRNLTRALAEQHAASAAAGRDGPAADGVFRALVERAEALLKFEQQMPERLAEPQRRRSVRIVYWSWRVESGVAAALIAALFLLGHSGWWLVLVVPHLVGTLVGWTLEAPAKKHTDQRLAAYVLHVVSVLLVLVVLGVITAWVIIAVLVGWAFLGVLSDETGVGK